MPERCTPIVHRETMRGRLERDDRAIHALLADPDMGNDLVLELYGEGHAWLHPTVGAQLDRYRLNPDRVVIADQVADDDPRYVLTDVGSRDLALAQLFDKGPTVADRSAGPLRPPTYPSPSGELAGPAYKWPISPSATKEARRLMQDVPE